MSKQDIAIKFEFRGTAALHAGLFADIVTTTEAVVYQAQVKELEHLAKSVSGIPPVALDAARQRIKQHRGEALSLVSAQSGSVVLWTLAAGLALYVLKQTLGETLKEAWRESPAHDSLKRALLTDLSEQRTAICQGLQRKFQRKRTLKNARIHVTTTSGSNNQLDTAGAHILVLVVNNADGGAPARGVVVAEIESGTIEG